MKMPYSAILQSLLGTVRHKPAIFSSFFLLGCFSLFLWPTLGGSLQFYYGDTGDARCLMDLQKIQFAIASGTIGRGFVQLFHRI